MNTKLKNRFRGFLPVVVDIETAGFNAQTDAILEFAAVFLSMDKLDIIKQHSIFHRHIEPFAGSNLEPTALEFTQIIPDHPFRFSVNELALLTELETEVKKHLENTGCFKAVLVGHNPQFDLSFIQAACERTGIGKKIFHQFTTFDTATLSALMFGETVLAKAVKKSGLHFNLKEAHSALYDAERTAELFCRIVNKANILRV